MLHGLHGFALAEHGLHGLAHDPAEATLAIPNAILKPAIIINFLNITILLKSTCYCIAGQTIRLIYPSNQICSRPSHQNITRL